MVKKILIIVSLFMVSALAVLSFGWSIFASELVGHTNDLIAEGKYGEAYLTTGATMSTEEMYSHDVDGMNIRAFNALSSKQIPKYNEDDKEKVDFDHLYFYAGVEIVFFNLSDEIDFEDVDKVKGYYNNEEVSIDISASWLIDDCNLYSLNLNSQEVSNIDKVVFLSVDKDENEEEIWTYNFTNSNFGYTEVQKDAWYPFIEAANEFYYDYADSNGEYDKDYFEELKVKHNENMETSKFEIAYTSEAIAARTGFRVKVVFLIIGVIAFNVVMVYFFIIRKPKGYNPVRRQQPKTAVNTQKENKNVIDVKEDSIKDNKESKEEVKQLGEDSKEVEVKDEK